MPAPRKDFGQPPRVSIHVSIPFNLNVWLHNLSEKERRNVGEIVLEAIQYYKGRRDNDHP